MFDIDSDAVRNALRKRIRDGARKVILVSHVSSDADSASGVYLCREAILRDAGSVKMEISYAFVNPGRLYAGAVDDLTIVMHIDTGGIFDPLTFHFDHHVIGCPYHSATEVIHMAFFHNCSSAAYDNVVTYVNRVDTGNQKDDLSEDDHEMINKARELLVRTDGPGTIARVIRNAVGPFYLAEIASSQPEDRSDHDHLDLLVKVIESYTERFRVTKKISQEMHRIKIVRGYGVRVVRFPAFDCNPRKVRFFLNHNVHDEADVMVMEITGQAMLRGETQQFGIAYLSQKIDDPGVRGIQKVAEALKEADPSLRLFFHHKDWLIYVKPGSKLTLDQVMQIVLDNLYTEDYVRQFASVC